MKRSFRTLVALILVLAFTASACSFSRGPETQSIKLTFYGLDDAKVFSSLISEYESQHPSVSVTYKKIDDAASFESRIINEIAEGAGPDIFYVHNTWLPRHIKKLVPLVAETFTPQQFTGTYVKVAGDDFIMTDPADGKDKIYALPLYVDTLALYYNKALFDQRLPERGKPATSWNLLQGDAAKFQELDKDAKLTKGEIAMGRADNVSLAPDILYALFLQAGETLYDSNFKNVQLGQSAQKYFDYYLSFAASQNKNYSWSTDLAAAGNPDKELDAFVSGKVAAVFGYSDLYARLSSELKNIKNTFSTGLSLKDVGVAPLPQIESDKSDYRVFANYYGLGVSRNSKNAVEAWNFVRYLGSKSQAQAYHKATSRPAARRDLIEDQRKEPITEVFISQLGYAASLRIFSDQQFADAIKDAITAANSGQTTRSALDQAGTKMNEILKTEAPEGLYPKVKKTTK